ncbi:MAG: precorrin-6y C5,15-methyltransferase (decarboxylating) subunit CbiE [Bacillaceae bacterium]|nr:precorrin-6y C5,15-methyltransferase (decarboxylating) subunit CbiE [Bacillaceae bacterium]
MNDTIKVIGIGDNGRDSLLPLYQKWIHESERLVGGERHLNFFPDYQGEKIVLKGGLSRLVETLQQEKKKTVVLASGDPLFYGIGGYLAKKMAVDIYPNLSSVQLAFARIKESWQDAYVTSVHGRSMKGLIQRIEGRKKVALLTDEAHNPNEIARYLLSYGVNEYEAYVAENLGSPSEKITHLTLEEMAEGSFSPLNIVILKQVKASPSWPLGIDDQAFYQRKPDKGLITKKEIRVLSLSQLNIREDSVVWDIGTCTGSVAIEAARLARHGQVYAIEKNEADLHNCRKNMVKFRTDFTVVHGKAPDGLDNFPDPDAVFIGGSGGRLQSLLEMCCRRLKPGGRIVLNAATMETLHDASRILADQGFQTDITLVQVSRSKPVLDMNRFEGLNPVFIITAEQHKGGETD